MAGIEITLHGVQFDAVPMVIGEDEPGLLLVFQEPESGISFAIPTTIEEAHGWADRVKGEGDDGGQDQLR